MADSTYIEGIDELNDFLRNHTKELDKSVLQSLTKGATVVKKEIAAQMPASIKMLKPIIASKALTNSKNPNLLVGIFGRKLFYSNKKGKKWDAFYLAYWMNYGTMKNRDSSHVFTKGVKSKNSGGIRPTRFFERAIDISFENALEKAEEDINTTIDKLALKFGFK